MKPQTILHYLLLATIATLPFAGVHFFVLGVPLYMPELLVIIGSALFVWIQWHTDTFEIKKLPTSIIVPITLLLVGLFSSAFFNGITSVQLGIIKSWFFFPLLFGWLLVQSLHNQTINEKIQLENSFFPEKKALFVWYATTVLVACVALVYFFQGNLTYDGRLTAFYLSPNYLALFLFPGVLLGWYFITKNLGLPQMRSNDIKKNIYFISAVLSWVVLCTTIYLTLSYTIITASILGFFIMVFIASNRSYFTRITLVALCVTFISFFLLLQANNQKFSDIINFNERSSLASRIMIWQASSKMIVDHPIIGIGPGNFQKIYLGYQQYFPPYLEWAVPHPHNIYLALWLQTGIIGLIGFLALIIFWIRGILHTLLIDTEKTSIQWTLLGILITLLLIGLLDTPYWKTDLAYEFWLLIALGL
jgi:O-antigen ligase